MQYATDLASNQPFEILPHLKTHSTDPKKPDVMQPLTKVAQIKEM